MSCRKCYVSGRVQGVYYRDTIRKKAQQLNITGHAFNLTNGQVEVLMCGTEQQIKVLESQLWQGSSWSNVTEVQCHDIESKAPVRFMTG